MINIKQLIASTFSLAPIPAYVLQDSHWDSFNPSASHPSDFDFDQGRFEYLDRDIVLFLPDSEARADEMFRALRWLYSQCRAADGAAISCAYSYLNKSIYDIDSVPVAAAHLLRCINQCRMLLPLICLDEEPQNEQCGLEPLFRALAFEAQHSLAGIDARFASEVQISSGTVCFAEHEILEAAFRNSLSIALEVAKDMRMRIKVDVENSTLHALFTFYSDVRSLDFDALCTIPGIGDTGLSFAILKEIIRVCGGSFRYANTNGVGELLLTLRPLIVLDGGVYYLNEFVTVDDRQIPAFCLEYADIYNKKHPEV